MKKLAEEEDSGDDDEGKEKEDGEVKEEPLLEVRDLSVTFEAQRGGFIKRLDAVIEAQETKNKTAEVFHLFL